VVEIIDYRLRGGEGGGGGGGGGEGEGEGGEGEGGGGGGGGGGDLEVKSKIRAPPSTFNKKMGNSGAKATAVAVGGTTPYTGTPGGTINRPGGPGGGGGVPPGGSAPAPGYAPAPVMYAPVQQHHVAAPVAPMQYTTTCPRCRQSLNFTTVPNPHQQILVQCGACTM